MAWQKMRSVARQPQTGVHCYGSDRDEGAIEISIENADRAEVSKITNFVQKNISDIEPPTSTPGLVIVNPPYGARIGDKSKLVPLYQTMGQVLTARFSGWRVGIVAMDRNLVKSTGLKFKSESAPIQNGGLRIKLFQTGRL